MTTARPKNTPDYQSCFKAIIKRIDVEKQPLSNQELLAVCRKEADFLRGETNPHFAHETAEAALNFLILTKYAKETLAARNPAEVLRDVLKPLVSRLPTQTWRSREQTGWQQFSTPPAIAYLLTYLLNPQTGDKVLEPSAGTGGLAVWSAGGGFQTHTNEIDPRRREFLRQIGFAPTAFDAEFINDFLPPETEIDCVLMNPPFSSNGERTKNNSSKYGFRHVESALERLKKGGKFGIILGEAAGHDTKTGRDFWRKLADRIEVKTIIKINGREYYKNGTTVDINLIVGRKLIEVAKSGWNNRTSQIACFRAESVEEAFRQAQSLELRFNQ
jgi:predicted RNA methylase